MIVTLIGMSGTGKSTVEEKLLERHNLLFERIISDTTRDKRDYEIDGYHYNFISKEQFEQGIKNEEYAEHAIFNGWYYGINKKHIDLQKKNYICVTSPKGYYNLKEQFGDEVIGIWIKGLEYQRRERYLARDSKADIAEWERRLITDEEDFHLVGYDANIHKVWNFDGKFEYTMEQVDEIIFEHLQPKYIEVTGQYKSAKIFTDNVENDAIAQVINLCNQPFAKESEIRLMPDIHSGKGCTIGTTMTLIGKACPNLVGVDIGCVSYDTEYLTVDGWKKISDYNGEEILVYNKNENTSYFEKPVAHIKKECDEFYHIKTKYGVDQKVSEEHKMLFVKGSHHRPNARGVKYDLTAKEVYEKHQKLKLGFRDMLMANIPNIQLNTSINLSNEQIRVQTMCCADGHCENNTGWCKCSFKKERKITRAEKLLNEAHIPYTKKVVGDVTTFTFYSPCMTKRIGQCFKGVNLEQARVILDEIKHWDCELKTHIYYSKFKEDADFVQYLWSITGKRATISFDNRLDKECYRVIPSDNPLTGFAGTPKTPIEIVSSEDGYKYCFTTSTGYWIMRHNDCICVTGNCGMAVYQLDTKELDLEKLDTFIHRNIPSGFNARQHELKMFTSQIDLSKLRCKDAINLDRAYKSLGSLGGGNHFIEVDKGTDGTLYLVIHSGSRNLGKQVCDYYQKKAIEYHEELFNANKKKLIADCKALGTAYHIHRLLEERKVHKVPDTLAYLEGQLFDDYIHDMKIVQRYAELNREAIGYEILTNMNLSIDHYFHTIHNYIDTNKMILRKGAVSAQKGETLLIPINMRDGSLLCKGKGNPDWNYSAPHGAGRLFSRKMAKELIDFDEFENEMAQAGIYTTSVNLATLDEAPQAYKPIEEIIDKIGWTVDLVDRLIPIYNFKA